MGIIQDVINTYYQSNTAPYVDLAERKRDYGDASKQRNSPFEPGSAECLPGRCSAPMNSIEYSAGFDQNAWLSYLLRHHLTMRCTHIVRIVAQIATQNTSATRRFALPRCFKWCSYLTSSMILKLHEQ